MKKLLILIPIILFGCETKNVSVTDTEAVLSGRPIKTYIIDSCEYIGVVLNGNGDFMSHKGNCRYYMNRQVYLMEAVVRDIKNSNK